MELRNNDRIFFDEQSHCYLLDDEKILIGVTSLMKKYGLSPDYSGIPEATLRKAAEEGTSIHKEIEAYDNGESVLTTELIEDYKKLGLKHIASEYIVSDNESAASAIDGVYEGDTKNGVFLVDYKSTLKVHQRALSWQLGIYKVFFERQNPSLHVDACYCIHIDKKTRRVKDFVPVEPVSETLVDSLLDAYRNGKDFSDPESIPSACLALTDDEMAVYVLNQKFIADTKERLKEVEAVIKEYDRRLIAYMQEHNVQELATAGGTISIKKGYERKSIDTAKLGKDYPQLLSKYEKVTEVSPSIMYKQNK